MFKFWHHHGILGINARNLLYIKPLNKQTQIRFADDKIRTKQFLSVRGVNTAKLLGKITSEAEAVKFPWDSLPNDFVLKPNSGYGGEGIWIIRNREQEGWINSKGELIPHADMLDHVNDILEGRYSITGGPDTVFFEQRLTCHPDMELLGRYGLPDIRVIVYNLVPIMAMVRVPTEESRGKANLHMGGLGLGIDLSKGEITHMSHYNRIIKTHPDFGDLKGTKIPFWNEVLLQATQIQQMITLGYLAVDIVIDDQMGPTLLEINARAGLGVQVANLAPLRDRLDRVAGVKVQTPQKGVRLAQDLFGNKIERRIQALSGKKVIGMEEEAVFNLKHGTKTVMARMNPTMNKNYIETGLFRKIADKTTEKLTLGYTLQGERGKTVFFPLDMTDRPYQVIFGRKVLSNFFLDVSRTPEIKKIPSAPPAPLKPVLPALDEPYWHFLDHQLAEFDRKLGIISAIRPLNLPEERKRFFQEPSYEPQFTYKPVSAELFEIKTALQHLSINTGIPLGKLFDEKRQELLMKADLIAVIGDDHFFPQKSDDLFSSPPLAIQEKAMKALESVKKNPEPAKRSVTTEEAMERFRVFLQKRGLLNWKMVAKEGLVSRCVVGKNNRLLVKADELFSEEDLRKLIAHEIETHVYCTENGKDQPYQIFRRGTAHYLKTQEGLAVYHQNQVVPGTMNNAILGFHAVQWGKNVSFRKVFENLLPFLSPEEAWKMAVKVKRGMSDTGRPGAFMKNALYFWGYQEVVEFLQKGGTFVDLFFGKFSLHQLDLIRQIPGMKPARYVPEKHD